MSLLLRICSVLIVSVPTMVVRSPPSSRPCPALALWAPSQRPTAETMANFPFAVMVPHGAKAQSTWSRLYKITKGD